MDDRERNLSRCGLGGGGGKGKQSKARKKTRPGEIRRKTDSRERMRDSKITRQKQPIPCCEDR